MVSAMGDNTKLTIETDAMGKQEAFKKIKFVFVLLVALATVAFYIYGELDIESYKKGSDIYAISVLIFYSSAFLFFSLSIVINITRRKSDVISIGIVLLIVLRAAFSEQYHYFDMVMKAKYLHEVGICGNSYVEPSTGYYICYTNINFPWERYIVVNPSGFLSGAREGWPESAIQKVGSCGKVTVVRLFGDIYYVEDACI